MFKSKIFYPPLNKRFINGAYLWSGHYYAQKVGKYSQCIKNIKSYMYIFKLLKDRKFTNFKNTNIIKRAENTPQGLEICPIHTYSQGHIYRSYLFFYFYELVSLKKKNTAEGKSKVQKQKKNKYLRNTEHFRNSITKENTEKNLPCNSLK